jgi:hypothetical protein
MNRGILSVAIFLAASVLTASCAGGHFFIVATSGTPQTTPVHTAFGAPLVVTVTNGAGKGVKGVKVTFTAPPQSGPSATFSGGSSTATATTDSNGVATSPVVTANGNPGGPYTVLATIRLSREPALFVLNNSGGTAAGISCVSGTPQTAQVNTAFANPLEVQVVDSGGFATNDPGVVVTFTPPAQTGPSVTFAGGVNTATTNAAGLATSVAITANGNAGGPYNVSASATVAGALQTCNFSLTNTSIPVTTENFVFYASGMEAINNTTGPNFYAVSGVVTIETAGPNPGQVMGGEQDYNDAFGITSPEPSGDSITGGQLTVSSTTGQGTLTLVTNNANVGGASGSPAGTEIFAVQFVNASHALISQFDASATSSGSMDLQTSTSAPGGSFAFTLAGVDSSYNPIVFGGVFTVGGGTFSAGTFDVDDFGTVSIGNSFPAGVVVGASDALGRGSVTNSSLATTINYYVVGPEAIRIIDVDTTDSALGSAFGQGAGAFSNSSLGTFVFEDLANPWYGVYDAAGILTTNSGAGTFQGVADLNEDGTISSDVAISSAGTSYSIAANGYGSLTIPGGVLGDVSVLGVYMTDPSLNLNDPNNTTSGTGGALIADLDTLLFGTGVIVPQTSTSISASATNLAFGAQGINASNIEEYDFVAQGSITALALNASGLVSDPFDIITGSPLENGTTFTGTATADGANPGRYTMSPLVFTPPASGATNLSVVIYQAGGGQLFVLDEDDFTLFLGPVEKQAATVTPLAVVRAKTQANANLKQ